MNVIDIFILHVKLDDKNRKLYHLTLSNENVITVHEDIMVRYQLTKGTGLETALIDDIINENQSYLAYIRAIRYLALKSRTSYQVATYLKQLEFDAEHIDHAIYKLTKDGYLDDERYAVDFMKFSSKAKTKGINWIKQHLNQIGLSREHISKVLEQYDDEQDLQLAIELVIKKWPQLKGEEHIKKQKCAQFLLRKGITGDIVRKAMKSVENKRLFDENLDINTELLDN